MNMGEIVRESSDGDEWEGRTLVQVDPSGHMNDNDVEVHYDIIKVIGATCRGGAPVYLARRRSEICPALCSAVVRVSQNDSITRENLESETVAAARGSGLHRPLVSFRHGGDRCFALFQYAEHGSVLSFMARRFPCGLPQSCILFFLYNTLHDLHGAGRAHRHLSAARVFVHDDRIGRIYSSVAHGASMHHLFADQIRDPRCTSVSKWAAPPELLESTPAAAAAADAADIWMLGITALEMAYGGLAAISTRAQLDSLVNKIRKHRMLPNKLMGIVKFKKKKNWLLSQSLPACVNPNYYKKQKNDNKQIAPVGFEYTSHHRKRHFSRAFVNLVADCLHPLPSKRPTATQLLRRKIFIFSYSRIEKIAIGDR